MDSNELPIGAKLITLYKILKIDDMITNNMIEKIDSLHIDYGTTWSFFARLHFGSFSLVSLRSMREIVLRFRSFLVSIRQFFDKTKKIVKMALFGPYFRFIFLVIFAHSFSNLKIQSNESFSQDESYKNSG
jgi:hypothetical protein